MKATLEWARQTQLHQVYVIRFAGTTKGSTVRIPKYLLDTPAPRKLDAEITPKKEQPHDS